MFGHDRELTDVILGRPRPITDHCRHSKRHPIPRDRRGKFRPQSDDVFSRASGDLNEPDWRHRDGNAVAPRGDQRQITRQQKRGRDVASRRDWPYDGAPFLRAR
jgi:hypothetical protein